MLRQFAFVALVTIGGAVTSTTAAVVVGGRVAWADASKAAAGADSPGAVRARQAAAEGRDAEAIAGFKEVYERTGAARLLFELGELHQKLGRLPEAEQFFKVYLMRDPKGPWSEAAARRLRQIEVTPAVSAPVVGPPPGSPHPAAPREVTVASPPPVPAPSRPSVVPAVAAVPSHRPVPFTPPASSSIAESSGPDARVSAHSTEATSGGERVASVAVHDGGGEPAEDARLPLPRWVPFAGAVLTVGLLAGASAMGISASHRYDQLRSGCGATPAGCSSADIDAVKSKATTANWLWGATAVLGVATGVVVYVDSSHGGISKLWTF